MSFTYFHVVWMAQQEILLTILYVYVVSSPSSPCIVYGYTTVYCLPPNTSVIAMLSTPP